MVAMEAGEGHGMVEERHSMVWHGMVWGQK